MNISSVDVNLVVILDALLRERSVGRAARRVGLSQPATSNALRRIRDHLGDPILERSGRAMMLTPLGRDLVDPVRAVVEQMTRIFEPAEVFDHRTTRRRFRIATSDFVAAALLPRLVATMQRDGTSAKLDVVGAAPGASLAEAQSGDLDLALGVFPEETLEGLEREELFVERMVCAVRRGHPLVKEIKQKKTLSVARYAALDHVLVAPRGGGEGVVDRALSRLGLKRSIRVTMPHFLVAPLIVAESDCILTTSRRSAETFADRLVLIEPPLELGAFTVSQVWHRRRASDPGHRWLRARLTRVAREA